MRGGVEIGEVRGHNAFITMGLLVPRNGPLPGVLKRPHPPSLPVKCANVKNRISAPREGEWEVTVAHDLWPQLAHLLTLLRQSHESGITAVL